MIISHSTQQTYQKHRHSIGHHGISVKKDGVVKSLHRPKDPLLKNYKLGEFIGRGANGEVFHACNVRHGKKVAVKTCIRPMNEDRVQLCMNEAFIHFKIYNRYPEATIKLDKILVSETKSHLIMDVGPQSLKRSMKQGLITSSFDVLSILVGSVGVLRKMHSCDIVHNDLKMDNLVGEKVSRGDWKIKLIDFGLSYISASAADKDIAGVCEYFAELVGDFNFKVFSKQVSLESDEVEVLDRIKASLRQLKDEEIDLNTFYDCLLGVRRDFVDRIDSWKFEPES